MSTCNATTILLLTSLSMKPGLQMAEQEVDASCVLDNFIEPQPLYLKLTFPDSMR